MSTRPLSVVPTERLADRRRLRRRRASLALLILALLLVGACIWGLWQPMVRIANVQVFDATSPPSSGGAGSDVLFEQQTRAAMRGTYFGIVPRDSIFFIPEHDIRARILAADASIASVSVFREGFTGLSVKINPRVAVARWCGSMYSPQAAASSTRSNLVPGCYLFDANGLLYTSASISVSSSTNETLAPFILYAPLASGAVALGNFVADRDTLPAAFDFARRLGTLGSAVDSIVIRDDPPSQGSGGAAEVDMYLASGTRITYVLGAEQAAFSALTAVRENLNLADGSLLYVDLRFPGNVYVKKK